LKSTAVLNIVGLTPRHIGQHTPRLKAFLSRGFMTPLAEPFPAVTCTSQSSMLTGLAPDGHGIVGNGWYFRDLAEVGFWKQSNRLVQGEKVYETLKRRHAGFTCAKLFWWYNMYADVAYAVTPRPHYPADGRKVFDVYAAPHSLHDPLIEALGPFPFHAFWGPASGIGSSRWIAECAKWTWTQKRPTLNLVYLPHLDYGLQRTGPDDPSVGRELQAIDAVAGDLIDFYTREGVQVLVVSEYGITPVKRAIHPNRLLREAGLLEVRPSVTWEMLDAGASRAFAVSDHQICHIYLNDKSCASQVAELFALHGGTQRILVGEERAQFGLNHERAGDIVLMADSDAWYTYYYWHDDSKAPDFARCVDIHRKVGYDPVELFFDPAQPLVKLKMAARLLQKKLGFRYYMNVIPLDASLVKGSHGAPVADPQDGPLFMTGDKTFASACGDLLTGRPPLTVVRELIERAVAGQLA
jgi:predicted AlkP superfamily pyrophosphatase or phosphodiesterase